MKKDFSKKWIVLSLLMMASVATHAVIRKDFASHSPSRPLAKTAKKTEAPQRGLLKAALLQRQTELEICYQNFLRKRPQVVEGAVTVSWLIDANGSVLSTELTKSDIEDESLTGCILEKLKGLSFSAPPDRRETHFAHKFHFRPKAVTSLNFGQ